MRMKDQIFHHLVIGISLVLLLSTLSSAISVRSHDRKARKSEEKVKIQNGTDEQSSASEHPLERQALHSENDEEPFVLDSFLNSRELVKKSQNVSEPKALGKNRKKEKEHSPPDIGIDENSDEDGGLAKADLNRESRGDKNPRIYYDDTAPRFRESSFEHATREEKHKDGKVYYPKNYLSSKYSQGPQKLHRPSLIELSGKRIPDHVQFDEGGHPTQEYPQGHGLSHQHPVVGHHEEHHEIGPVDDTPYSRGIEEHSGKSHHDHHIAGYGNHHHYGSYRHTLSGKVDAVGKALQVLIPSALLITGVSALFPNRVHVPTTPNKYRQKRSVFRRRVSDRRMAPPPELIPLPSSHIPPELEDIPSHILHAEHRIMDGNPAEMYPEYGKRYGAISAESTGFDPFKVFKGPGPEAAIHNKIQNAMPLPEFPPRPNMEPENSRNGYVQEFQRVRVVEGNAPPSNAFAPAPIELDVEVVPSPPTYTSERIIPQISPVTSNLDAGIGKENVLTTVRKNILRRRTTRKPPIFLKETPKISVQHSSESQKSQYLIKNVKNTLDDSKQINQEKAEQEFMSTLQNLVTPDIAKAIVENKNEPPKDVDLSPDGPVIGLLTSYAQHENDTPSCQKRALCELAVKGKSPKSTKFEAFLWSVATLVPDVFSEMYDLQEVFQAIRNEQCIRFECSNPNMDLQV